MNMHTSKYQAKHKCNKNGHRKQVNGQQSICSAIIIWEGNPLLCACTSYGLELVVDNFILLQLTCLSQVDTYSLMRLPTSCDTQTATLTTSVVPCSTYLPKPTQKPSRNRSPGKLLSSLFPLCASWIILSSYI